MAVLRNEAGGSEVLEATGKLGHTFGIQINKFDVREPCESFSRQRSAPHPESLVSGPSAQDNEKPIIVRGALRISPGEQGRPPKQAAPLREID